MCISILYIIYDVCCSVVGGVGWSSIDNDVFQAAALRTVSCILYICILFSIHYILYYILICISILYIIYNVYCSIVGVVGLIEY